MSEHDPDIERLKERAWREVAEIDRALAQGRIDEESWHAAMAALARRRLPHWAARIHVGNIRSWRPAGERFDFVLLRPQYAPEQRRVERIRHVMDHVMRRDGRLIVLLGPEEAHSRHLESNLTAHGISVDGRIERPHPQDSRLVRRLFWIDARLSA